ncbi:30S ribosomal protein S6e [Candidatus Woesearchaeota archaeon]|jgi:small subunit ribosomal protein S6e|nr:30S ribosomal protein S6e [Candidatus Woesearchaeota archaeon]MBT4387149.1 30S ribosomal protein S6e [Candidatus Woesearchaeota archaeon]MBT4596094.1 30S ribosomal protein S6e [Candidatus Woesearchaeota archaeon]MBT5741684.1 30S ribosomal protein S6e [Candidatus Woesearchaeota archaeon]MBT6505146.1 30S ribosomal protein S6e [Candidatus Woesearchaeota archaeon]
MVELKIVIADQKEGRSYQKVITEDDSKNLYGKKIKDTFNGEMIDLPGYELKITGGSDISGFPMRWDIDMSGKRKILAVSGVGLKLTRKGMKKRKTVSGNTIYDKISQINVIPVKFGDKSLKDIFGAKEEATEAKSETPEKTE